MSAIHPDTTACGCTPPCAFESPSPRAIETATESRDSLRSKLATALDQLSDARTAKRAEEARSHEFGNRIQANVILDIAPEWVVTGDPKFPTLAHLLESAYVSWSDHTDAQRSALKRRIADIRIGYLTPGGPSIALTCFRCGRAKNVCTSLLGCCQAHRLHEELRPDICADCARTRAEVGA